jgi:hypothetical protein
VAALAADPQVRLKSGGVYNSGALSEEYGFTDIDGNRPNMYRYMEEHFPNLVNASRRWRSPESSPPHEVDAGGG